ncbi:uncharacterized protein LOC119399003 isoform X1 [Rhipicephalus sanguineus]|uniref:uncharacterized protein LOC119399003 isoform X1 n=1 Tax=Rhipicephalus sanguineus TaxID=34632 RepID=UPI0020C2975D|nr:uncharacterized protein LOC119399003 isoform X1 [Rhipicephalus sanguineus]
MNVRLRANEPLSRLAEQLTDVGGPLSVGELDLTNCIGVDVNQLLPLVAECGLLQRLRCPSCAIPPSNVIRLAMQQLPYLTEVEFSCLVDRNALQAEIKNIVSSKYSPGGGAFTLRRIYCEVGQHHNFVLLLALLHHSPNANDLHVHLVCGDFQKPVEACRGLLATHRQLETFTFTSELPSPIQDEPVPPFDFATLAAVCANISHLRSINFWNCTRLRDLADDSAARRIMLFQTILVAVEDDLTTEWIRLASVKHDWKNVRQLCLVLLPPRPSIFYPAAGGNYRDCLRAFSNALAHVVEINISTFHFEIGLDVTALLQEGSLQFLQSLSAPPCGFRRVSALRRLALHCSDFQELDVRFERRGRFSRCDGCEGNSSLVTEEGTEFRDGASPVFRNGLARLTLSQVHDAACLWFIESCKPMATLRLSYCPLKMDYELLSRALADSSGPSCLIIQHHLFRLDDTALLANLDRFAELRHLYLLSEMPLSPSAASNVVTEASRSLPHLKCLHAHYQDIADPRLLGTITWMRGPGGAKGDRVLRGGPCFQSCSTATFIGLAKPLNRDIQPML